METAELLEAIARGEDGKHQFKANFTNTHSLAAEMVAFSNSRGGHIFIGVTDDGNLAGLKSNDIGRLNQLISNAASQSVRPPINPETENIASSDGLVMVVTIPPGAAKPYMDNNGIIWVKSGADKRKVTSREELQRMFQAAGLIHGDEVPTNQITVADVDLPYFREFFMQQYGEELESQDLPMQSIIENMNLMKDGVLNIAGALLFAKKPEIRLPSFIVKCVSYPGNDIHVTDYRDSQDATGKLDVLFTKVKGFILRNLKRIQDGQGVNSLGRLEISEIAIEEVLTNALIHRDYFISAPIRVFVFDDRVEIISPGHLPNNLTIDNIKTGNSNIRNSILASFATKLLPYRGFGSGIRRAIKEHPSIEFKDDRDGNLFMVTLPRPTEGQ